MRGFGALAKKPSGSSSSASNEYQVLTDPDILELVRWLENSGASISGLAVTRFPNKDNLRGVVALKPFKKGDVLLSIPEALTIDCSGSDRPEEAGFRLLQNIQKTASEGNKKGLQAYIRLLPRIGGDQFATTTDFFTEEEFTMLQWPPVQEETIKRLASTKARAESSNTPIEHLKWAIWLIVSRVIAIATRDKEGEVRTRKLLIPFLDFLNHDGKGVHQLSAKNGKNGLMLRVVAGADVAEGEEITFAYGAGGLGGDRFVQDYGFLPPSSDPALQKANRQATKAQKPAVLEALRATTLEEDRALLANKTLTPNQALAIQFRIGLKEAL